MGQLSLGNCCRRAREEECLTRAELARRCRVQRSTIDDVEADLRRPWPKLAIAIDRELHVKIRWLEKVRAEVAR